MFPTRKPARRAASTGGRGSGIALTGAMVGVAVLLGACGASPPAGGGPQGLPAFYSVPADATAKPPGTLLKWQQVRTPGLQGTSFRVMYVSRGANGSAAAVTGLVFVPAVPAPPGGYPVLSWAHGTNGMALQCAPSLEPATALPSVGALDAVLDLGWEVVATDYQGEGTPPGVLPYLVGEVAAFDVIDIVRAARHLPAAHAGSRYAIWGYSEGGQAAMFAWHLGPGYGSQDGLQLVGVAAGAPPSQLVSDLARPGPEQEAYAFMTAVGFNAAYGNRRAPLSQVLTATGQTLVPQTADGCLAHLASVVDQYPPGRLFKGDSFTTGTWRALLEANDPESFTTGNSIPLLLVQGGADTVVDPQDTQLLADHLCGLGQPVEAWLYPGLNHGAALVVSAKDVAEWTAGRFAGRAPGTYVPTGEAGIVRRVCPG